MSSPLARVVAALGLFGLLAAGFSSFAQAQDPRLSLRRARYDFFTPPSGGTDPGSSGFAIVISDAKGPDVMGAFFRGLAPNTCYALFLTSSPVTGSTPGSLLARFCANGRGNARIGLKTEIVDSFVFLNNQLDADADGIVVGQGAGVLANGGFMVPTPVLRVYRAQPDQGVMTVFSGAAGSPGGLHTLSTNPIR